MPASDVVALSPERRAEQKVTDLAAKEKTLQKKEENLSEEEENLSEEEEKLGDQLVLVQKYKARAAGVTISVLESADIFDVNDDSTASDRIDELEDDKKV